MLVWMELLPCTLRVPVRGGSWGGGRLLPSSGVHRMDSLWSDSHPNLQSETERPAEPTTLAQENGGQPTGPRV